MISLFQGPPLPPEGGGGVGGQAEDRVPLDGWVPRRREQGRGMAALLTDVSGMGQASLRGWKLPSIREGEECGPAQGRRGAWWGLQVWLRPSFAPVFLGIPKMQSGAGVAGRGEQEGRPAGVC